MLTTFARFSLQLRNSVEQGLWRNFSRQYKDLFQAP